MARPCSSDLRERVVRAMRAGESCRSVAAHFSVAPSSAMKWAQRAARTGSVLPGKIGGHRKPVLEPQEPRRAPRHPRRGRPPAIPAALQSRPEPHRAGLRELKHWLRKAAPPLPASPVAHPRRHPPQSHPTGVRELPGQRRIRFRLKRKRSRHVLINEIPAGVGSDSCVDAPSGKGFVSSALIGCFHVSGLSLRRCPGRGP